LDNGSDQGTAWQAPGFNDSTWASGPAQLGYGDGDEATVVSFGPNSSAKYITTYFRTSFNVANPAAFTSLTLQVRRDDGIVVYLNGVEIYRNTMPTGTITYTTPATVAVSDDGATWLQQTGIGVGNLVAGNNIIAVEIHQSSGTSSDISFDLQLAGVQPGLPSVIRGPYLQKATSTTMTVQWRTSAASDSRVRYGTDPGNLNLSTSDSASVADHVVTLSGLSPDTQYYYTVGTTTTDLAGDSTYLFFTAPNVGTSQPMRFWVLGDAGTGTTGQQNVRTAYYNFTGARYTDLILMLGDNAYESGTDAEYQNNVFNIYPTIFRKSAIFSTIGNHDTAQSTNPDINTTPYFLIFNLPTAAEGGGVASGTEKYYSFNYGNVHFVCLDSMTSDRTPAGPMLTWLQQDLAANTADWLVAFWHHPPYSKGSHNSDTEQALVDMRVNALPILEAHGVDLVLGGHSHSYERSYLIDSHYGLSTTFTGANQLDAGSGREEGTGAYQKATTGPNAHEGTVYVVPGSAGQISGGTLNHPAMFISLNQLCAFVIDIDGNRLDATSITDTGVINDHFTVLKGSPANNPPAVTITAPQNGATYTAPANVTIEATATDSDGSVASVTFYRDGNVLGTDASAPFSFDWTGVAAGTYSLTAVAMDNLGAQAQSPAVSITVNAPPPPAAPSGLGASAVSASQVNLSWTDNANNETGFSVERATSAAGPFAQVGTAAANGTTFSDTTVSAATTYYYRVRAFNDAGNSAYSNTATVTTPVAPPAAPSGLNVTAQPKKKMKLGWRDNSANETAFLIERATNAAGPWAQIASVGANTTSHTDVVATGGITYFYRVRATNAGGNSAYSNTDSATAKN
jgi:hypothetical protein